MAVLTSAIHVHSRLYQLSTADSGKKRPTGDKTGVWRKEQLGHGARLSTSGYPQRIGKTSSLDKLKKVGSEALLSEKITKILTIALQKTV